MYQINFQIPFRLSSLGIIINTSSPPFHSPFLGVHLTVSSSNIIPLIIPLLNVGSSVLKYNKLSLNIIKSN